MVELVFGTDPAPLLFIGFWLQKTF